MPESGHLQDRQREGGREIPGDSANATSAHLLLLSRHADAPALDQMAFISRHLVPYGLLGEGCEEIRT
jgi:hypothetical protein